MLDDMATHTDFISVVWRVPSLVGSIPAHSRFIHFFIKQEQHTDPVVAIMNRIPVQQNSWDLSCI